MVAIAGLFLAALVLALAWTFWQPQTPRSDLRVSHPWATDRAGAGVSLAGSPDRVFLECAVVQGNGFNWAATIGWMAGQFERAALRAEAFEARNPGQSAFVDPYCFTGSSSGGAVASLLDRLLTNPRLVAPRPSGLLSPQETRDLSEALIFLGLSMNFSGEGAALVASNIASRLGLTNRDGSSGVFGRPTSSASAATRVFNRWITAAALYDPAWFDDLTRGEPFAIPTYLVRSDELPAPEKASAAREMRHLAYRARRILDGRTTGMRVPPAQVSDGFCVTSFVSPAGDATPPLPYGELGLVFVCNTATFDRLVRDDHLRRWLSESEQMGRRMFLAARDDWAGTMDLTTREPGMTAPLFGARSPQSVGVESAARFEGSDFAAVRSTGDFMLFGGFAGPRLEAWPATALLLAKMRDWRAKGVAVSGRVALFGKTEDRDDPAFSFAQSTIADYFTAAPDMTAADAVRATLARFYAWQDEYCRVSDGISGDVAVEFYRMDWNLTSRPAAMTGDSHVLAALGYDLGNVQRPDTDPGGPQDESRPRFLFAEADSESFVGSPPPGGLTCRLKERGL